MRSIINVLAIALFFQTASAALILPRSPRGGGRGSHGGSSGDTSGSSGDTSGSSGSSPGTGGGGGSGDTGGGSGGSGGTHDSVSSTTSNTCKAGNTYSSGAGRGFSGDTGSTAIYYFDLGSPRDRDANYFSGGGGSRYTVGGTSVFPGREAGGGLRADVPGTRSYGSGYPYSQRDPRTYGVVGQPFPFGFWPLYWYGYGKSDEYGGNSTVEWERPGGDQVFVQLRPNTGPLWGNDTLGLNQTLWMIGDDDSVTTLLSLLVDRSDSCTYGCGVKVASIQRFDAYHRDGYFQFDNVIQWYRTSSFALAYTGYNNTYALPPHNQTFALGWDEATPLPSSLASSPFLQCINSTILAALPIVDQAPPFKLPIGAIVGIVIGGIAVSVVLCFCACCCIRMVRTKKKHAPLPTSDVLNSHPVPEVHEPEKGTNSGMPPIFRLPEHAGGQSPYSAPVFPSPYPPPHAGLGPEYARRGSTDSGRTWNTESKGVHGQDRSSEGAVHAVYVMPMFVVKS